MHVQPAEFVFKAATAISDTSLTFHDIHSPSKITAVWPVSCLRSLTAVAALESLSMLLPVADAHVRQENRKKEAF
jgi:hypothetical protein